MTDEKQIQETDLIPEYYSEERAVIHNEIILNFTNLNFLEPDKYGLDEITRLIDKQRNNPKFFTAEDSKCLLMYLREYYMTPASRNEYYLENSQ